MTLSINNHKIRVGIDVGGTFTHAVALDANTLKLIAKAKVLTTHEIGVAQGIVDALLLLMDKAQIDPQNVNFIAYSTTQATNALLEGDLAIVGILALSTSDLKFLTTRITKFGNIKLDNNKFIETHHEFLNIDAGLDEKLLTLKLKKLQEDGAQAIAITQAYGTDNPEIELKALSIATDLGYLTTCGVQVSQLYGLKARTMTSVINAAMLPKMLDSANLTQKSIREANITAPIMIMRSDGGVMDIESMRKKPILTVLSGPASGVAAATMYLNISDGIFIEVGGTSSDISVIKNGQAMLRYAEIGSHKLYTKTLDIRTVGIGGGSMIRIKNHKIFTVGPRSAHIANCKYAAFYDKPAIDFNVQLVSPKSNDPNDYLIFQHQNGDKVTFTVTCAANSLAIVPPGDNAYVEKAKFQGFMDILAQYLQKSDQEIAQSILDLAAHQCIQIINRLIKLYALDINTLCLYGGGGGASTIVEFMAQKLNYTYKLANNNDVISAIGVALALLRDSFEKSVINPSSFEIIEARNKIEKSLLQMGADIDTIEINVEVDSRNNILKVVGTGASLSASKNNTLNIELSALEKVQLIAKALKTVSDNLSLLFSSHCFEIYSLLKPYRFLNFYESPHKPVLVVNTKGVIRFKCKHGLVENVEAGKVIDNLNQLIEKHSSWGDAGKIIPGILLVTNSKIIDLTMLMNQEQLISLATLELKKLNNSDMIIIIVKLL